MSHCHFTLFLMISIAIFRRCFHHYILLLFFFNDTATTEIYTLSLHDALPIWLACASGAWLVSPSPRSPSPWTGTSTDRKSTRLNSSHQIISYAVFCLKKKKTK